jgi:ParB family chromosome partitioning protein
VCTTVSPEGIAELAASLMAHGHKQNLVVRKEGKKFAIIDGKRRFMAHMVNVEAGRISANFPVPCLIDETKIDGKEISLIANTLREDMHPADEFEAFKALVDAGHSTADIAARRGCPESHVAKLLKLANCWPVLLQKYRQGEVDIEQLMAFAVTDDHAAQEQVFGQVGADGHPHNIRRLLTANEIPAADRRVRYVGVKAYSEAGGQVKRDLFSDEENGTFIVDPVLLEKLAGEKLGRAARAVQKEGWKWVDIVIAPFSYDQKAQFRRVQAEPPPLPEKLQKEFDELSAEYDLLVDDDADESLKRLDAIDARMQKIGAKRGKPVFTAEQFAIAGAVVTIGDDGRTEIVRGLMRPEDMPKKSKAKASGNGTEAQNGRAEFSAGLMEDLTAQKSVAISAMLMDQPDVALAAVVYSMVLGIFGCYGSDASCLQMRARLKNFHNLEGTKALGLISAAHEEWSQKLPGTPEALWQWCMKQKQDVLLKLLACCAAHSIDAVRMKYDAPDDERLRHGHQLAAALKLDMKEWFTPTADYFSRIGKPQILAAISEAKGQPSAPALEKLKKGDLAGQAERLVAGTGWLPSPLRLPA